MTTTPLLSVELGQDRLYLAIVKAIRRDIQSGRLQPGERLPTQRELADNLGVAVGTVTRAYTEAERQSLVRGEIGRGTFVREAAAPSIEPSLRLPADAEPEFIDLSLNYPLYSEEPDLAPALRELATRPDLSDLLHYQASEGMRRHRRAGVAWLERFGVTAGADSVVVCAGAQHALTVSLASVAQPGDLILTEQLTYPGVRGVAELLHLKLVGVAMDEHGLRPDALAAICRQRKARALYLTPTLQNPTSTTLSESRRREIVAIAREHDLWIVEDDVHRRLVADAPPAIATLAPNRTFFIAGTSKSVAGGLRIAFLAAPPAAIARVVQSVWATVWVVPPLCAEVVTGWIQDGTADATVMRKRKECAARQKLARRILRDYPYQSHGHGLYVWLPLPAPWTSSKFAAAARDRRVGVTPSEMFRVDEGEAPAAVRICLGAPHDRATLERALHTLVAVLSSSPGLGASIV